MKEAASVHTCTLPCDRRAAGGGLDVPSVHERSKAQEGTSDFFIRAQTKRVPVVILNVSAQVRVTEHAKLTLP